MEEEKKNDVWEKVKSFFATMSKTTKKILAVILILVLLLLFGFWFMKKNQPYSVVFYDLSSADIQSVSQWLSDSGVSDYKIEGSNVLVPSPIADQTKAALYMAGYPNSGSGYETYYNNIGAMSTDTDKATAYIQDLQDRLAGVIRNFPGVSEVVVNIAEGEDRRYVLDSSNITPTKASVWLKMEGNQGVSDSIASAIRVAVTHSVADLNIEYVAITDSLGNSYSSSQNNTDSIMDASYLKLELEEKVNNEVRREVLWALERIYGSDDIRVSVRSTVDVNRKIVASTEYPEPVWGVANNATDGRGLIGSEYWNNYSYGLGDGGVGGIVGANPNSDLPMYPADTDGDGVLDTYGGSSGEIIYQNPVVEQQIEYLAGTVTDVQVSVTINSDATNADYAAVETLMAHVANAAGISAELQNDKVSIMFAPFVEIEETAVGGIIIQPWMLYAIAAGLALFIIIIIIVVILLRKKKKEQEEQAALEEEQRLETERLEAEEAAAAAAAAAVAVEAPADGADIMDMNTEKSMELRKDLRTFVGNNPEIAASLLRNLMKGGEPVDAT